MSDPSSEFEIDIDEEDLQQIDAVEQEAIASLGSSLQSPNSAPTQPLLRSPPIVRTPPTAVQASPRSPSVYIRRTTFGRSTSQGIQQTLTSLLPSSVGPLKGRNRANEPPTHHYLDREAAKTWIYPTNVSFREYQFNIVQKALLDNVLVSLPTGLGKTFIAATVMFNYYRWFPKSKIVFVAPTKPLVAQQVEACFNICGVPYSQTAQLTGTVQKPQRAVAYQERKVFYMTPQTLSNDIKSGLCDPKSIVCLVIDEAHRGTGNYAYTECVKLIRKKNPCFRVLALSATPGSSVDAVQNVITALCIARVEIRIESSLDLLPYLHPRKTDVIVLPLSPEIIELRDQFAKVLQHFLNPAKHLNDYRLQNPLTATLFSIRLAREDFMRSPAAQANEPVKFRIGAYLAVSMTLANAMWLLICHGIQPFYEKLTDIKEEYQHPKSQKSKTKQELLSNKDFHEVMNKLRMLVDNPNTVGHPKLERAASLIIDHFMQMEDQKQDTRVMVFAHYRSSAAELVRQLRRQEPIIKPTIFVGQSSDTRGGAGMKQKEQIEVIQAFKDGKYNVLVATSIGEEGLDIGDVDLIICYDTNSSPVRMLQRMGRTGRKREGRVVFLCTEGKEEKDHIKSQVNYLQIQRKIAAGDDFDFDLVNSPRILPPEFQPACVKKEITPPNETPQELELKVDQRKKLPKAQKDWSLPENVDIGFVRASSLGKRKRESLPIEKGPAFEDPASLSQPFITEEQEERVKRLRVHVSPTARRIDILDIKSHGSVPAGALRKRLVQTRKAIKHPRDWSESLNFINFEDLTSTPPNLIAEERQKKKPQLSEHSTNVPRQKTTNGWKNAPIVLDDTPSSPDSLPDISAKMFFGKKKDEASAKKAKEKDDDSDAEYGLPSDFEITPRKRIRIEDFSDDE